jgi:tRNA splicing endonuclease
MWEDRYDELVNYYQILKVPNLKDQNLSSSEGIKNFMQHQRQEYRKWKRGEPSTLNETKIALLNDINFVWDKNQRIWDLRFAELIEFKREFGHVNVPMKYKTLGQC